MLAGDDVVMEADSVHNRYSQIEATGDIRINAAEVRNWGLEVQTVVRTTTETVHDEWHCSGNHCHGAGGWGAGWHIGTWTDAETTPEVTAQQSVYGTIHARGTVYAQVIGHFENDAIKSGANPRAPSDHDSLDEAELEDEIGDSTPRGTLVDVTVDGQLAMANTYLDTSPVSSASGSATMKSVTVDGELEDTDSAAAETRTLEQEEVTDTSGAHRLVTLSNLQVSIDSLLRRTSLFVQQLAPDMPYLIETRPEFIQRDKYLGSDTR